MGLSSKPHLLIYSAIGLICIIVFNFAATNMAALYILGDLGGSFDTASYSLAYFGFGNCVAVPLGKLMGFKYGRKKILTICLVCFCVITLLVGLSPTYPVFICMRFLQGVCSGPLLVLVTSLINKLVTPTERGKYIRLMSVVMVVVPVLAASTGGTLAYLYDWRWSFYAFTFIIFGVAGSLLYQLRAIQYPPEEVIFDIWGYLYFFVGVLSLASYITLGQQLDYLRSPLLRILLPVGIVSMSAFVIHSWNHPSPIISFRLLKNPSLSMGLLVIAILFGSYFGIIFLISQWLHLYVNYTPWWIMVVLGIMTVTALGLMLIVKCLSWHTRLFFLLVGIAFLAISCFYSATFNVEVNFARVAISRVFGGIGLALFLPPLLLLILGLCSEEEGIDGLTLFQCTRTLASGLGAPFFTTIWFRREAFYHTRLGSQLTLFSQQTAAFFSKLHPWHVQPATANAELNVALDKQAHSLALNDTFYLMGWIFVFTILLILTFRLFVKPKRA